MNRAVAVIPARYGSTRLPGKALCDIGGRPMVVRVLERVRRARRVERAIVATDDERIAAVVQRAGGEARLTSPAHASGSDRVAEVVSGLVDCEIVVNVQGDEPLLDPATVDAVIAALDDPGVAVATASAPYPQDSDPAEPSLVKVATDASGRALDFSRRPIPGGGPFRVHLGLYAFRKDALLAFTSLPPSARERAERLEQLRLIEHGIPVQVVPVGRRSPAVDTPEDLERVRRLFLALAPELAPNPG